MARTILARLGILLASLLLLVPGAPAAGRQDFTLHNETGVEIHSLHVSPHNVDDWQEDVLGRDTLADGDSVQIEFSPKERAASWDLKITDHEGAAIVWEKLNLLEISDITLHFDAKTGQATAEFNQPPARPEAKQDFTLHNKTGVEIHSLHVSPHNVDDWQEDVLGRDTLSDDESIEISFSPKERAAFWDLKVTDDEGTAIVWEKLNLLEISEITLHFDAKSGQATADLR